MRMYRSVRAKKRDKLRAAASMFCVRHNNCRISLDRYSIVAIVVQVRNPHNHTEDKSKQTNEQRTHSAPKATTTVTN